MYKVYLVKLQGQRSQIEMCFPLSAQPDTRHVFKDSGLAMTLTIRDAFPF